MAWHTPLFRAVFPGMLWHHPRNEKSVYLTFDDGPDPDVTPCVLDLLANFGARATFFCVGKSVEAHPEIYRRILAEGHAVGNHTWSHLQGWRTPHSAYVDDVKRASGLIDSTLFRPPYGELLPRQWFALRKTYRIVMWDVLAYDWDPLHGADRIAQHTLCSVKPGSVVVLHDSAKAAQRMLPALERILGALKTQGYGFKAVEP